MSADVPGSWSVRSLEVLREWSVLDWTEWADSQKTIERYAEYVDGVIRAASKAQWWSVVCRHKSIVPYYQFEDSFGSGIARCRDFVLSETSCRKLRSWCRLRCGLLTLRHLNRKDCDAKCFAGAPPAMVWCIAWPCVAHGRLTEARCRGYWVSILGMTHNHLHSRASAVSCPYLPWSCASGGLQRLTTRSSNSGKQSGNYKQICDECL